MPNIKSAIKRVSVSEKKAVANYTEGIGPGCC